jgi:hypothetical protein
LPNGKITTKAKYTLPGKVHWLKLIKFGIYPSDLGELSTLRLKGKRKRR